MSARVEQEQERLVLGAFRLEARVGRGATSEVWRATHQSSSPVAIKLFTSTRTRETGYAEAFRGEVRAAAGLDHPNIISIFDFGQVTEQAELESGGRLKAGSPYLVMELAEDGCLKSRCGRLSWTQAREALLALLDALAHAHARSVLHRDVKPGNVLMGGLRPGLKLTDFGLAHALDGGVGSDESEVAGTPAYMAPEQFEGRWRDFGPWTDLYALGCTAWALLCGRPPFGRESPLEARRGHLCLPLPALESRVAVPEGLETWLNRLLEKDTRWRFQRAADAALALRELGEATLPAFSGDRIEADSDISGTVRTRSKPSSDTGAHSSASASSSQSGNGPRTMRPDGTTAETTLAFGADPDGWTYLDFNEVAGGGGALPTRPIWSPADSRPPLGPVPPVAETWRQTQTPATGERLRQALMGVGLRLYGLRAIPLVNREHERDALWDGLQRVGRDGVATAIALIGSAGCGKSRLAEWLCERAHELGAATVFRASHGPSPTPNDGLSAMVARHLRCVAQGEREALSRLRAMQRAWGVEDSTLLRDLLGLVEPLLTPANRIGDDGEPSILDRVRFRSPAERHAALIRLLRLLTAERPIVVWLDDPNWDADALRFVGRLLDTSRQDPLPVLILVTIREESLAQTADGADELARLFGRADVTGLGVGPLPEKHRVELIRHMVSLESDLMVRVADRTAGNPLFAVQLLSDWIRRDALESGRGGFRLRAGAEVDLPGDLHAVWRERLEGLLEARSADARTALELAALLGQEVQTDEWSESCRRASVEAPWELVDRLLVERLARTLDGSDRQAGWSFVHGMLRESLLRFAEDSPDGAARLRRLRLVCADALEIVRADRLDGATAERIARLRVEGGAVARAIGPLLLAARARLSGGEYAMAEALLEERARALMSLGVPPDDLSWEDGLALQARVCLYTGRIDEAQDSYRTMLDAARAHGRRSGEARALQGLGHAYRMRGQFGEAEPLLREADALAEALGDRALRLQACRELGRIKVSQGRLEDAGQLYNTGYQIAWSLDDAELQGSCLRDLTILDLAQNQLDSAARSAEDARLCFERAGFRWGLADNFNMQGEIARRRGDLDGAEQGYRRSIRAFQDTGSWDIAIPQLNLGALLLDQGRRGDARRELALAETAMTAAGTGHLLAVVHVLQLRLAAAERDEVSWARHLSGLDHALSVSDAGDEDLPRELERAAEVALDAGSQADAIAAWTRAEALWLAFDRPDDAARVRVWIDRAMAPYA